MKDEKLYRESFLRDTKTQDAVIRNFEIIGESAKRVSQVTRNRAPKIPWTRIAGFRDILIHQYEGVDLEEVWKRVEQDLSPLLRDLRTLLNEMEKEG